MSTERDEEESICRAPEPEDYDDRATERRECAKAKEICPGVGAAGSALAFGGCLAATEGAGAMACFGLMGPGYAAGEGLCNTVVDSTNEYCKRSNERDEEAKECDDEHWEKREKEKEEQSRSDEGRGGDAISSAEHLETGDRYAAADVAGPDDGIAAAAFVSYRDGAAVQSGIFNA